MVSVFINLMKVMPSSAVLTKIRANAQHAENIITGMKSELDAMKNEIICRAIRELEAENARLRSEIDNTKQKLVNLETARGVKQVPLPSKKQPVVEANSKDSCMIESSNIQVNKKEAVKKVQDETKQAAKQKKTDAPELPVDVGRLDMRIGHIKEIMKHQDADSLYVSKVDCGEPELRTVVSGLVKFIPIDYLRGRMVVLLVNLKPVKMRGVTSQAMIMCASTPDKVEVLVPPNGSLPGDLVHCEGYSRNPDDQLNPKKKIFETCAPDLKTNENLIACYKNAPLYVPNKGKIVCETLAGVQIK